MFGSAPQCSSGQPPSALLAAEQLARPRRRTSRSRRGRGGRARRRPVRATRGNRCRTPGRSRGRRATTALRAGGEDRVGGERRAAGAGGLPLGQRGPGRGDRQAHQARAGHRVAAARRRARSPSGRRLSCVPRKCSSIASSGVVRVEPVPARRPDPQQGELGVRVVARPGDEPPPPPRRPAGGPPSLVVAERDRVGPDPLVARRRPAAPARRRIRASFGPDCPAGPGPGRGSPGRGRRSGPTAPPASGRPRPPWRSTGSVGSTPFSSRARPASAVIPRSWSWLNEYDQSPSAPCSPLRNATPRAIAASTSACGGAAVGPGRGRPEGDRAEQEPDHATGVSRRLSFRRLVRDERAATPARRRAPSRPAAGTTASDRRGRSERPARPPGRPRPPARRRARPRTPPRTPPAARPAPRPAAPRASPPATAPDGRQHDRRARQRRARRRRRVRRAGEQVPQHDERPQAQQRQARPATTRAAEPSSPRARLERRPARRPVVRRRLGRRFRFRGRLDPDLDPPASRRCSR